MSFSWTLPEGAKMEEAALKVARDAVPGFLFKYAKGKEEILRGMARMLYLAWLNAEFWVRMTYITKSVGIWLAQHAKDRGTFQQSGETTEALRARLRRGRDAVTRPSLQRVADAITQAEGVAGNSEIVNLCDNCAFWGDTDADSIQAYFGDGDTADGNTNGDAFTNQTGCPHTFVVIIPSGAAEATRVAVDDAMRIKKAAGFRHTVEVAV
jgi:hypothetical protein